MNINKDELKYCIKEAVNISSIIFGILIIIIGMYLDTKDPVGLTFDDVLNFGIGVHITFSGIRNL